jgi:subtilisin-like proprotein convertase family protein
VRRTFWTLPASLLAVLGLGVLLGGVLGSARAGTQTGCTTTEYSSTGSSIAIPDPGTVDSSVTVPAGGDIQSLTVGVDITHPFDSDLDLQLVAPTGKIVELANGVGMWGHDFTGTVFDDQASTSIVSNLPPFTGHFRPVGPLSALQGSPQGGVWKLQVEDRLAGYSGQLNDWHLEITSCPSVSPATPATGAPTPPPLPTGVPQGALPLEGTPITVTSSGDDSDGDVSSPAALEGNPGPDGTVSLREAIEATNSAPGAYTILFAPSLSGSTIDVGSSNGQSLPALLGGHVMIDGDINGDGQPDITLDGQQVSDPASIGLQLISGGNRLHSLHLADFGTGVLLAPVSPDNVDPTLPSHQTYAGNVVSGLVITGVGVSSGPEPGGIVLLPNARGYQCAGVACATDNQWLDTRFVGNTVVSRQFGIGTVMSDVAGDEIQRLTVAGNHIEVNQAGSSNTSPVPVGIDLKLGLDAGANSNTLSDALVAYNDVEPLGASMGIVGVAGQHGGSSNVIDTLTVIGNHIAFSGQPAITAGSQIRLRAISFGLSDGCSGGPGVGCSNDDVIRHVQILGNVLTGQSNAGVMAAEPCCGSQPGSILTDIDISDNLVEGLIPPGELNPWGIVVPGDYDVSNVTVDSNTVEQTVTDSAQQHLATLASGGIVVAGGIGAGSAGAHDGTGATGVTITNNLISTPLAGITLVGGGPSDDVAAGDAYGHKISDVLLGANKVTQTPTLALNWDPLAKGIDVIGGVGGTPPSTGHWTSTHDNSITSVTVKQNSVLGVTDDVYVRSNFGPNASGNVAALGLTPPTLTVQRSGSGAGTVESNPSGIDCGATCSSQFDDRTRVALTASARPGSRFVGWSGACAGTAGCTVVMNGNQSVAAGFDRLCIVPKVGGKTLGAARRLLHAAHCRLGHVRRSYSKRVKKGRILSQHPRAHTRLAQGAAVNVVVSKGKKRH